MKKYKKIISILVFVIGVPALIWLGVILMKDRKYNIVSMMIAIIACIPNCYSFEKKQSSTRKMVLISVMVAMSVIGRCIFALTPFFKPVTAIVIITAMYLGSEAGFLTGALSALVSNVFYGQGPWTPFQMFSWGFIGYIAGLPFMAKLIDKKIPLIIYGAVSGFVYSMIMDVWSTVSLDGGFNLKRYGALIISALPVTALYAVSNVVFLLILRRPIGDKFRRIKLKHNI